MIKDQLEEWVRFRSPTKGVVLPMVSIVITNFNYAEFVRDALLSAVNQTYPRIEVLVVDDVSTDGSWELICDLVATDPRFAAITTKRLTTRSGQTGAAAAGLDASSGTYVIFLDADDVLLPRCVETHVYAHLSSRLPVGFSSVGCLILLKDEILTGTSSADRAKFIASGTGRLAGMVRPIDQASEGLWLASRRPPIEPDDIHYVLPPQCEPWVWSYMSGHCFRRDALRLFLRGPLEGLKTGTDGFLVKPISALCGSMVVDKAMMGYRVHGNNAFITTGPLLQMRSYGVPQIKRMVEIDRRSIAQMLDHAETFVEKCESPISFFRAIESLCLSWPMNSAHGDFDYLRHVQTTYESDLVRICGREEFDEWVGKTNSRSIEGRPPKESALSALRWLGQSLRARLGGSGSQGSNRRR